MASLLHLDQKEGIPEQLFLFDMPTAQTAVENYAVMKYRPLSAIGENNALEFHVPPAGGMYLDVHNMSVYVQARVEPKVISMNEERGGLNGVSDDVMVNVINNLGHSFFSEIEVYANQKLLSVNNYQYHHKAYIKTLLESSSDATESQLTAGMFHLDTPGHLNSLDPRDFRNRGAMARYKVVMMNQKFDTEVKPHIDIASINKYLLNGVELRFRLHRNRDELLLMVDPKTKAEYKITMLDCILKIPMVRVSPGILRGHGEMLATGLTAKYAMSKTDLRTFTIEKGATNYSNNNLFPGYSPKKIVMAMIASDAHAGHLQKSPFNYQDYKMRQLAITMGDQPVGTFQPDFSTHCDVQSFLNNFKANGKWHPEGSLPLTKWGFGLGYALYSVNLDPTATMIGSSLLKTETARLDITFAEPLEESVTVLVYSECDRLLQMDQSRGIIYDIK